MPNTVKVVIQECHYGAAQSDLDMRGWSFESRNKTQQVAQSDEDPQTCNHRNVTAAFMTDDFLVHVLCKFHYKLHRMLEIAGMFNRQATFEEQSSRHDDQEDEHLHREIVGDGVERIPRRESKNRKKRRHQSRQEFIQYRCKPDFVLHSLSIMERANFARSHGDLMPPQTLSPHEPASTPSQPTAKL